MSVSFPFVLLLTDFFKDRKINSKSLAEKIPFFILSIVFGIVAIFAQRSLSAIYLDHFTLYQHVVFACSDFMLYIYKLLFPFSLCAYYPYPIRGEGPIPVQYYGYALIFFALLFFIFYSLRFTKKIIFGFGFFAITVFLVLQLLPVGDAMIADRYAYLPSIGVFYLISEGIISIRNTKGKTRKLVMPVTFIFATAIIFYSFKTYQQCHIWKNSLSLWNDVISKYQTVSSAYNNRGFVYAKAQKSEDALNDFNKALELKPDDINALNNRGLALINLEKYNDAYNDFTKIISIKATDMTYANRGFALYKLNRNDEALADLNKSIEMNPHVANTYNSRGLVLKELKKYEEAYRDYSKVIQLKPDFILAYNNRAIALIELKRIDEAVNDLRQAIAIKPDYAEATNNLGTLLVNEKRYSEAVECWNKAVELQPGFPVAYFWRGVSEYYLGKKDLACSDFQKASSLGYPDATQAVNSYCR